MRNSDSIEERVLALAEIHSTQGYNPETDGDRSNIG